MINEDRQSAQNWQNPNFVAGGLGQTIADNLLRGEVLRQKAAAGWTLGTFLIELPTPATLTALALAGFEFVVLDMEHSGIGFSSLEALLAAAISTGLIVLVRVWGEDVGLIGKVLDMGAHGIMAPHISSPEQARRIVEEARFTPRGKRGFSPLSKFDALQYPLARLGEAAYVVLQIEGREAMTRVAEISATPGIDAVFVGPYDLALSMNLPPGSAEVLNAAGNVAASVAATVQIGIYIDDPASCQEWADRHFTLQCLSFDGRMLARGAAATVAAAKDAMNRPLSKGADHPDNTISEESNRS